MTSLLFLDEFCDKVECIWIEISKAGSDFKVSKIQTELLKHLYEQLERTSIEVGHLYGETVFKLCPNDSLFKFVKLLRQLSKVLSNSHYDMAVLGSVVFPLTLTINLLIVNNSVAKNLMKLLASESETLVSILDLLVCMIESSSSPETQFYEYNYQQLVMIDAFFSYAFTTPTIFSILQNQNLKVMNILIRLFHASVRTISTQYVVTDDKKVPDNLNVCTNSICSLAYKLFWFATAHEDNLSALFSSTVSVYIKDNGCNQNVTPFFALFYSWTDLLIWLTSWIRSESPLSKAQHQQLLSTFRSKWLILDFIEPGSESSKQFAPPAIKPHLLPSPLASCHVGSFYALLFYRLLESQTAKFVSQGGGNAHLVSDNVTILNEFTFRVKALAAWTGNHGAFNQMGEIYISDKFFLRYIIKKKSNHVVRFVFDFKKGIALSKVSFTQCDNDVQEALEAFREVCQANMNLQASQGADYCSNHDCPDREHKNSTQIITNKVQMLLAGEFTFTKPIILHSCSQCQMARYCSKACQRNDWARHKTFCRNFCLSENKK